MIPSKRVLGMATLSLSAATARKLRLVTFDVTGTLLNFRLPPAEQYSYVGAQLGVHAKPSELADGFKKQWRLLCDQHPNFGAATGLDWRTWWSTLVKRTFLSAPSLRIDDTKDNRSFSAETRLTSVASCLIEVYSTAECWSVVEGTEDILSSLQRAGLTLGVISNFDSRLDHLLRSVGLWDFFTFTVASYDVGVAKPDVMIFHEALKRGSAMMEKPLRPWEACHVGNTLSSDYVGAKNAGWNAILVVEGGGEVGGGFLPEVDPTQVLGSLKELEFYLLSERPKFNKSI